MKASYTAYYNKGYIEWFANQFDPTFNYCQSWAVLPGTQLLPWRVQAGAYVVGLIFTIVGLYIVMRRINERIIPRVLSRKRLTEEKLDRAESVEIIAEGWNPRVAQAWVIGVTNGMPVIMLNVVEKLGTAFYESARNTSSQQT